MIDPRAEEPDNQCSDRSEAGAPKPAIFGLCTRKERWGPSWRGWLLLTALGILGLLLLFSGAYPFLAVTHRVDANVLVVEGWIHEYAVRSGADEFKSGAYEIAIATGGPVHGTGGYTSDYMTSAHLGAELLRKTGVPTEYVQMAPSRVTDRDRTYGAALALHNWLLEHKIDVRGVNIVTEGAHARRTRLLFERALGGGIAVGVIAVPSPDYDEQHWWQYSEGVREVIGETIAYGYARLLFHP